MEGHPDRWKITVSIMLATLMTSLDQTIANIALPHIQGTLSASQDEIAWVLTSYIVATAIMTPMTGWLSERIGPRRLMIVAVSGFTLASMLCGLADNLPEMVGARLLQGLFAAPLGPLSQAVLLDVHPRERHPQAMAIWGMGTVLGPLIGPVLGGFLTDSLSWRWIFFINLPVGALALIGIWRFLPRHHESSVVRFDFLGFGALVAFVGGLQLMLDRGPGQDWFYSREIWIEAMISLIGLWVFITHSLTAARPTFDRGLARDRNFMVTTLAAFCFGVVMAAPLALLPPFMQQLLNYPVMYAGVISMSRGLGAFFSIMLVGQIARWVDARLLLLTGMGLLAISFWQMSAFDLSMSARPLVISGLVAGASIGFMIVPLTILAFATLAPSLRAQGSAMFSLVRNTGSSVGISILQAILIRNGAAMHASISGHVDPANVLVQDQLGGALDPASSAGLEALNGEISRQATMVAYVDDFRILLWIAVASMLLLLFLRPAGGGQKPPVIAD